MRCKRRHRRTKGVATMVGAIFAIAIMVTAVATFFTTNQIFARNYQNIVSETAELNREMAAEEMLVSGHKDTGNLTVRVENTGTVPFTVIAIFIVDRSNPTDITIYTEAYSPGDCLPRTINPGDANRNATDFHTPLRGSTFWMKVLTERGNVGAGVYPEPEVDMPGGLEGIPNEPAMAIGYGPTRLDFSSLHFINTEAGTSHDGIDQTGSLVGLTLGNLTVPGYPAFAIPNSTQIVFTGNYTNRDKYQRDIALNSLSVISSGASPSISASQTYYILKNYSSGIADPLPIGENYTLPWEVPTLLYFGATSPGSSVIEDTPPYTSANWFPGVFMTLSGISYNSTNHYSYGQTIPFVATTLISYELDLTYYGAPAGGTFSISESSGIGIGSNPSRFISYPMETSISAGLLLANGTIVTLSCVPNPAACYEESTGNLHGTFRIPDWLPIGYYAAFITDNVVNIAWVTIDVRETETMYVNAFDSTYTGWNATGSSPYLDNNTGNYIFTKTDGNMSGIFEYEDHNANGTFRSVNLWLELNGSSSRDDYIEVYIDDGSGFTLEIEQDVDANNYTWYSYDITSKVKSWSEVDATRIYFVYQRSGSVHTEDIFVRQAYLEAIYSP